MTDWAELAVEMDRLLRLATRPIAYKRLESVEELEKIPKLRRLDRIFMFCQIPSMVRRQGWTIGLTRDNLSERCARIMGLAATTEEEIRREAEAFEKYTWFGTVEDAMKQLASCPLIPPGEAIVLAPLQYVKFDPDVILIYGNPAQISLLMNGLQFRDYERFQFFFTGEGACADSLAQCYVSGKPALAIPCMGERTYGTVTDDELNIALPPGMMEKAVEGLKALSSRGLRYPIWYAGPQCDVRTALASPYPG